MIGQGTVIANTEYFNRLTARINGIDACGDLQEVVDEVFGSLQATVDGIEAELLVIAPILELLTLDITDLPKIITFLEKLVTLLLTPYLRPYITYAAQLTALGTSITSLIAAVENAQSRITSCSISIPSISV